MQKTSTWQPLVLLSPVILLLQWNNLCYVIDCNELHFASNFQFNQKKSTCNEIKNKWGHFIRIVLTIPTSAIFTLHPISELKACRFQSQATIPNVGSDIDLTHAGSLLSSEISWIPLIGQLSFQWIICRMLFSYSLHTNWRNISFPSRVAASTYFASRASAKTPAASGAAAEVPEWVVVQLLYKSVVAWR